MRTLLVIGLLSFIGISCKTTQNISIVSPYAKMIDTSSVLSQSMMGMALYDLGEQKMILREIQTDILRQLLILNYLRFMPLSKLLAIRFLLFATK